MDVIGKTIWQQASGDTDRDYADLCLQWDVILNGPGYAGPWPECKKILLEDGRSPRKMTDLRRFCVDMKDGDIVVLRRGTSTVVGIGQVVGNYEWRDEFSDVDGWDLEHVRRVRWLWKHPGTPKCFATYTLKQGDTTQPLDSAPVNEWLSSITVADEDLNRPLIVLPESGQNAEASLQEISEYLFDHGVASASIQHLTNEMDELVRIARWYQRAGMPSEHETVAYLIAPLLRGIGWTPQRMAIEWNHVDLALFDRLPRSNDTLTVVVEAKKMNASCLSAMSQARSYAEGKTGCHRLIVTDGLRYGIYVQDKTGVFHLYSYMNLTNLRKDYPIYHCKGAKDTLLAMAPEWRMD